MASEVENNPEPEDVNTLPRTPQPGSGGEPTGPPPESHVLLGSAITRPDTRVITPTEEGSTPRSDPRPHHRDLPPEPEDSWIGAYRLIERLGAGTFGVVYRAEQERPVRRQVAIKLLKGDRDARQLLGRFEVERQALALMDHPGIARIFDAGETDDGHLYFVMELVVGEPITEYCDRRHLSIRERIELMMAVCRAVQHAHQKGVIHRDLKPSNVLVREDDDGPVPKVIDFGIAKAIGTDLAAPTDLTECFQILGTPTYMSPEQATLGGIDVDTRSDIYALGVMLYEILTGSTPIPRDALRGIRHDQLCRLIQEQDPQRPSTRVFSGSEARAVEAPSLRGTDRAGLTRQLRGDLDWIVMKCLEKDRSRRYETANALMLDLQRHLACEPVLASPPSLSYRFKKFARRNLVAVIATALLALVITGSLVISLILLDANRERTNEVLRLSDANILQELDDEYDALHRLDYRRQHDAMASWIDRAREALGRRDWHRATLERLRRSGTPVPEAPDPSGAKPATVRWRFRDRPTQWQHDLLQDLLGQLDELAKPGGRLDEVREWLRLTPSAAEINRRWARTSSEIAAEYPGIRLARQEGLVPIGRDPASKLWEFVDLQSGMAPDRDRAGRLVIGERTGVVFVFLPGGRFRMGSPEGEPGRKDLGEELHDVELSPMLIAKYEITQAQWVRATGRNPSRFSGALRPADSVSWLAAQEFCEQVGYRLPSEAQWEYACRGGSQGRFSVDAPLDELAWYDGNSGDTTHPVGRKRPNPFGLHDMHGNVLEWCQDVYSPTFYRQPEASGLDPVNDPPPPLQPKTERVLRGGPFDGVEQYCRCADRWWEPPNASYRNHGLRPVWPIR